MPRFSAFNPFGQMRFSSRPSHGEKFYRDMVKALGGGKNYTTDFDSLAMGRVYAMAMAFGRCRYALERAGNQFRPDRALELLPTLEREYGLVPENGSSIGERRSDLAVAARIARGGRRGNVQDVFTEHFGAAFIEYITVAVADAVNSTSDPASRGVYDKPGARRSVFRLVSPVGLIGQNVTVQANLVAGDARAPAPGQRIIVDPGDNGRVEAVTVASASIEGTVLTLTASFTKGHVSGAELATGRHPNLTGSKRHNVFLMTDQAVRSNRMRRKASRAAHRLVRAVSTWAIADDSGPFKVNEGELLYTTIGEI